MTIDTSALVAAPESRAERSARVKKQLRDKNGRWIEMGGGASWRGGNGSIYSGTVTGTDASGNNVRVSNVYVKKPDGTTNRINADVIVSPDQVTATPPARARLDGPSPQSAPAAPTPTPVADAPQKLGGSPAPTGKPTFANTATDDVVRTQLGKLGYSSETLDKAVSAPDGPSALRALQEDPQHASIEDRVRSARAADNPNASDRSILAYYDGGRGALDRLYGGTGTTRGIDPESQARIDARREEIRRQREGTPAPEPTPAAPAPAPTPARSKWDADALDETWTSALRRAAGNENYDETGLDDAYTAASEALSDGSTSDEDKKSALEDLKTALDEAESVADDLSAGQGLFNSIDDMRSEIDKQLAAYRPARNAPDATPTPAPTPEPQAVPTPDPTPDPVPTPEPEPEPEVDPDAQAREQFTETFGREPAHFYGDGVILEHLKNGTPGDLAPGDQLPTDRRSFLDWAKMALMQTRIYDPRTRSTYRKSWNDRWTKETGASSRGLDQRPSSESLLYGNSKLVLLSTPSDEDNARVAERYTRDPSTGEYTRNAPAAPAEAAPVAEAPTPTPTPDPTPVQEPTPNVDPEPAPVEPGPGPAAGSVSVSNAVDWYSDDTNYADLNNALRTDGTLTPEQSRYSEAIDNYLNDSRAVLPAAETVYRGVQDPDFIARLVPGTVLTDNGYVSTTRSKTTAAGFGRGSSSLLEIELPKGTRALDVDAIQGNGTLEDDPDNEAELLLPRGQNFEVTSVSTTPLGSTLIKMRLTDKPQTAPTPTPEPEASAPTPPPTPTAQPAPTQDAGLSALPTHTYGSPPSLDANGNRYVTASDGVNIAVGSQVYNPKLGTSGVVVTVEGNGRYVQIRDENGNKRGLNLSRLVTTEPADSPSPAPARPAPAAPASTPATPTPSTPAPAPAAPAPAPASTEGGLPAHTFGTPPLLDANGNRYVSATDGTPLFVGSPVYHEGLGYYGQVVRVEGNGRYLQIVDQNGIQRGLNINKLTPGEPNTSEAAPAAPAGPAV